MINLSFICDRTGVCSLPVHVGSSLKTDIEKYSFVHVLCVVIILYTVLTLDGLSLSILTD